MADLLRIATSGLIAHQAALNVTGHNIANASVDSYSRQRVEMTTLPGNEVVGATFGNGVQVAGVGRLVDQFVIAQLRSDTSIAYRARMFSSYGEQLDTLYADPTIGVSDRIDDFFAALGDAASNPQSIALRRVVLDGADALVQRFNAQYARLAQIDSSINARIGEIASQVGRLAEGVARLNGEIGRYPPGNATGSQQQNDLFDQRDQLILQIAELVDVQVVADGASLNLYLGKGLSLVTGTVASNTVAVADPTDYSRRQLAIQSGNTSLIVSSRSTSGELGGLLAFREQMLDPAFNSLGRIALVMSDGLNEQNALGIDLEGNLGGKLFADLNEGIAPALRVRPFADNDPASTGRVRVLIDDPAQLTTSDYRLDIDAGGAWRLLRLQDATLVASGASLSDTLASVDGFSLDLNLSATPAGTFAAGDSFLIQPTRLGAQSIAVAMDRPEQLALAGPVRASAAATNLGNAVLGELQTFATTSATFATPGTLSPPLQLRFTSTTSYDVLNADDGTVLLAGQSFMPGANNTLFSTDPAAADYFGFQLTLGGNPAAGDSFRIDYNAGAVADNRNARALSALQSANTVDGGRMSYQQAYNLLVSGVASTARAARIERDSSGTVLEQAQARREQMSGVNLDEEAANLIRFEQAYNASAQVIAVARSVLDALFAALR